MTGSRFVFWILRGVAGVMARRGLMVGRVLPAIAGVVLALAAGGIEASTRSRERHDAERRP